MRSSAWRLAGTRVMTDWAGLHRQGDYAQVARALINDCVDFDFEALANDASGVLHATDVLEIVLQESLPYGCGGGGYYQAEPPVIYLHPSISRRDNFTLLHELGHHLQQNHPEWAYLLLDLSPEVRRGVEEKVSNEVATNVLMPWADGALHARDVHPADVMAGLFSTTQASRSAVLQRVVSLLPASAKWILAVADTQGVVEHSRTTYSDAQPAKGSTQPGFALLAEEATDGPVRRRFVEGLRYSTGSELHDMKAEAVLDHDGRYIFVALTPEARFGTGRIEYPTYECSDSACGKTFEAKWVRRTCERCGEPACSWCDSCGCDPTDTGQTCPKCFLRLTPAEVSTGSHECW